MLQLLKSLITLVKLNVQLFNSEFKDFIRSKQLDIKLSLARITSSLYR